MRSDPRGRRRVREYPSANPLAGLTAGQIVKKAVADLKASSVRIARSAAESGQAEVIDVTASDYELLIVVLPMPNSGTHRRFPAWGGFFTWFTTTRISGRAGRELMSSVLSYCICSISVAIAARR